MNGSISKPVKALAQFINWALDADSRGGFYFFASLTLLIFAAKLGGLI